VDQDDLAEPMRSRWSPSVLDPAHVLPRADVRLLLEAARWAPSRGNSQPAHFLVCERGSAPHAVLVRHLTRGNSGWVPRASVVLLTCAEQVGEHADHDTGQAAAHVTLQAVAMGYVAHQFSGFDRAAVAAELGVPDDVRLLAGIAIGVRGDPAHLPDQAEREQRPRERRSLEETAYGERWGVPWS
jgi:nitroreductase